MKKMKQLLIALILLGSLSFLMGADGCLFLGGGDNGFFVGGG